MAKNESSNHYYVIGIADPGRGKEGTMFFSKKELKEKVDTECGIEGMQVWLEHGDATREVVGTVRYAWVDTVSGMHVVMMFDKRNIVCLALKEWIQSGVFRGISMGYDANINSKFEVVSKKINEISLVGNPFWSECRVYSIVE